ncbi:hypothetical protein, partial [Streptomyces adustus]
LLVLCAAMFLDALDVSMVGVALPSIGSDLHPCAGPLTGFGPSLGPHAVSAVSHRPSPSQETP